MTCASSNKGNSLPVACTDDDRPSAFPEATWDTPERFSGEDDIRDFASWTLATLNRLPCAQGRLDINSHTSRIAILPNKPGE